MTNIPDFGPVIIRGMHFRGQHAKDYVEAMEPGDTLLLEREPDNHFDPNAIKVLTPVDRVHIGYIGAESAQFVAYYMDEGLDFVAILQDKVQEKNNTYPLVRLEAPTPEAA